MRELWYPAATRSAGPPRKVSGSPSLKKGAVYHSMVGAFAGAYARLMGADTASWHFSILQNGMIYQHYPVNAWAWHCGDRDDPRGEITNNRDLIGIEHEGGPPGNTSEPLTDAQLAASAALTTWLLAEGHIGNLSRIGDTRGLWEHREMYATACPSGRIPWARLVTLAQPQPEPPDQVQEDDDMGMTPEEKAAQAAIDNVQNAILVSLKNVNDAQDAVNAAQNAIMVALAQRTVPPAADIEALDVAVAELKRRQDAAAAALGGD